VNADTSAIETKTDNSAGETKRLGRLLAFNLRHKLTQDSETSKSSTELISSEPIDVPAILDLKWSFHTRAGEHPVFALADALGGVTIWNLEYSSSLEVDQPPRCKILETVKMEENGLALSLDWSNALERNKYFGFISEKT